MQTLMNCALGHQWALTDGNQGSTACPICGSPATERLADTAPYGDRAANIEDTAAPATADPVTSGRRPVAQRFTILRPHAQGGLGRVSVARDERLRRDVALKEIRPDRIELPGALERFVNEAEITSQLEHPGVVPIYALDEDSAERPRYAMRFIQGRTLADVIQAYHRQPSPASCRDLLQRFVAVCQTVAFAHSKGVIHRDLKPANIMLGDYGETLVVDWGLAKRINLLGRPSADGDPRPNAPTEHQLVPSDNGLTQAGEIVGTLAYMSPEQAVGDIETIGPATDIFALGAVLYQVLTGVPPYSGNSSADVLRQVLEAKPRKPSQVRRDVPTALERICLKAMSQGIDDRYASAAALSADVEHWLADEPTSAYAEPWTTRLARWSRRRKAFVAGATVLLLATLISGSVATIWYQQVRGEKVAEEARLAADRSARSDRLNAQVGNVLGQAEQQLEELHRRLSDARSSATLLSEIDEWDRLATAARDYWNQSQSLIAADPTLLDSRQHDRVKAFRAALEVAEKHWSIAKKLDAIQLNEFTLQRGGSSELRAGQYAPIFTELGLDVLAGDPASLAEHIRRSPLRFVLVAAVDDWAALSADDDLIARLLRIARLADPDPWRDRVRRAEIWNDAQELQALASEADLTMQPPQTVGALAIRLQYTGSDPIPLLEALLVHYPRNFWLHTFLATWEKEPLKAVVHCRSALAVRPNSGVAWLNLGTALYLRHDLSAAVTAYRKAVEFNPQLATAWSSLGAALSDQQSLDEAAQACHRALEIDPTLVDALNNLGIVYLAQGKPDDARTMLESALQIDDRRAASWANLAETLRVMKQLDQARQACLTALEIDSRFAPAWNCLGNVLADQKKPAEAIDAYHQATKFSPSSTKVWNNLGWALFEQQDLPGALAAFQKSVALDPENGKAWIGQGVVPRQQREFAQSIAALEKAAAISSDSAGAWNELSVTWFQQGEFAKALAAAQESVVRDASSESAWINLSLAHLSLKNLEDAESAAEKAVELAPALPPALNALGEVRRNQRKFKEAAAVLQKAVDLDPNYAVAWSNLGAVLAEQKQLKKALEALRKAVSIDPKLAVGWHNLGLALALQDKLPEATTAFQTAVDCDPKMASAWINLGSALGHQDHVIEATAAFRKAVEIEPTSGMAWDGLATALFQQGQHKEAIECLREAIKHGYNQPDTHGLLASLLMEQGEFQQAILANQRALELQPPVAMRAAIQQQLKESQRLLALEQRLPSVLLSPAETSAADLLQFAQLCYRHLRRHRDAAVLYAAAFARDPQLKSNMQEMPRSDAACAAVLAMDDDRDGLVRWDEMEEAKWRKQALDWIREDLSALQKVAAVPFSLFLSGTQMRTDLARWRTSPDLAAVRDAEHLKQLPQEEQDAWRTFWDEVQALDDKIGPARGK